MTETPDSSLFASAEVTKWTHYLKGHYNLYNIWHPLSTLDSDKGKTPFKQPFIGEKIEETSGRAAEMGSPGLTDMQ